MKVSLNQYITSFAILYGLTIALSSNVTPSLLALCVPFIWLSIVDLQQQIIPNEATLAIAAIGILRHFPTPDGNLTIDALTAAFLLGGLWLIGEIYWRSNSREALGLGDVKLISTGVLCVGAAQIWFAILVASLGGIAAILVTRKMKYRTDSGVPFGPFIAYGLFVTLAISRV